MKNPFWKYTFFTAATMAAGILCLNVLLFLFGQNPFGQYEFMFLPIYLILLVWGMFRYRRNILGGYLEGWRAVSFGIVANFVAIILYSGLLYGFFRTVPTAFELHKKQIEEYALALKKGAENNKEDQKELSQLFADAAEEAKNTTIASVILDKFIKIGAVGMMIVMMATLFMIKKRPEGESYISDRTKAKNMHHLN